MKSIIWPESLPGNLGKVVVWVDRVICVSCALVLWICFFVMFLPTLANTILRYTTDSSLTWSVEIIGLSFPWFIMAGAVLAAQLGQHISIDFLVRKIPNQFRRALLIFVQTLILITTLGVIYVYLGLGMFEGGIEFAAGDSMYTSLNVSQSWSYLAILVGYILLSITAITTIYRSLVDTDNHLNQYKNNIS